MKIEVGKCYRAKFKIRDFQEGEICEVEKLIPGMFGFEIKPRNKENLIPRSVFIRTFKKV